MVLHLRAPKGKVSVEVMLNRAKYFDRTGKVNDHTIYLSGNLGKNALEFAMCLSAKAKGGRVYTMGHTLVVEGADEAVLYFGADKATGQPDGLVDYTRSEERRVGKEC